MLETLINPRKAEKRPWEMFFIGVLYAALAVAIADFVFLHNSVFEKHISLISVFFVTMFSLPFMFYLIKLEETKDFKIEKEKRLIKEHGKALAALLFLFFGYVVAFSLIYLAFPGAAKTNFKVQVETYCQINAQDVEACTAGHFGSAIQSLSMKARMSRIATILSNNFSVLVLTLLFSFIFGAGAIFVLAWNASVIAAAVGIFSRSFGLHQGLLRYLIHGLPEMAAYFIIALAGCIIGKAVIRHGSGKHFWHVLQDSLDLIILALVVLIVAAFIEVFITPVFF